MTVDVLVRLDVPCEQPWLVAGYVAIADVMARYSDDFDSHTDEEWDSDACTVNHGETPWCGERLEYKRNEPSYDTLVAALKAGKGFRNPVQWHCGGGLGNGHHRVIAAFDCGFTHVPYSQKWGEDQ
jgi:hypothetical protein